MRKREWALKRTRDITRVNTVTFAGFSGRITFDDSADTINKFTMWQLEPGQDHMTEFATIDLTLPEGQVSPNCHLN